MMSDSFTDCYDEDRGFGRSVSRHIETEQHYHKSCAECDGDWYLRRNEYCVDCVKPFGLVLKEILRTMEGE